MKQSKKEFTERMYESICYHFIDCYRNGVECSTPELAENMCRGSFDSEGCVDIGSLIYNIKERVDIDIDALYDRYLAGQEFTLVWTVKV